MSLLVGDVGGTNARFGLVADGSGVRPAAVGKRANDGFPRFEDAVADYLAEASERPRRAAFAIAGPVAGRIARLTNRGAWEIDADALEKRFGLDHVTLMNDFVAQAAALPHLHGEEVAAIGDAAPSDEAAKAALGPGTGLGVAGLVHDGRRWIPIAGEGGHVELAATTPREAAALDVMRRERGRVSAEDALSGPGLARLHRALASVDGRALGREDTAAIVEAAKTGDSAASETVAVFLAMLARFAGDVALTFGARGGVYLCGGVAPRLMPLIDVASFRAAFEAKRPHEAMMAGVATLLVTSDVAGLVGCAAAAGETDKNQVLSDRS